MHILKIAVQKVSEAADVLFYILIETVIEFQAWRCARARRYLLTHDYSYRNDHSSMEIVRRRNELYGKGISPLDPTIPDRWSMEEELPDMAWPRKNKRF